MRQARALLATLILVVALPAPGVAAGAPVVAVPGSFATNWATPWVAVTQGTGTSLVNQDITLHGIEALRFGPDDAPWCGPLNGGTASNENPRRYQLGSCPLFWAGLTAPDATSPVLGVETLAPGTYGFRCSLVNRENMRGLLIVLAR